MTRWEFIVLKASPNLHNAYVWRGKRVGLLGGSFNPPHEGHLHISRIALCMLKLDAIWWLVSPGNPLKDPKAYAPLPERLSACELMLTDEPRMLATDIEDALGTQRSFDTLNALNACFPQTNFVFLMGSDSASNFHKWYRWQDIPGQAALAVLGRPPVARMAASSPLKLSRRLRHIHLSRAESVPLMPGSCFWVMHHPLQSHASSDIRKSL